VRFIENINNNVLTVEDCENCVTLILSERFTYNIFKNFAFSRMRLLVPEIKKNETRGLQVHTTLQS
jgi:hypothetical protein